MNKSQLVDAIAKEAAITKVDAKKALDAFIAVTGNTLKATVRNGIGEDSRERRRIIRLAADKRECNRELEHRRGQRPQDGCFDAAELNQRRIEHLKRRVGAEHQRTAQINRTLRHSRRNAAADGNKHAQSHIDGRNRGEQAASFIGAVLLTDIAGGGIRHPARENKVEQLYRSVGQVERADRTLHKDVRIQRGSVSSFTTSSKSVISLLPDTCHIPVIPGFADNLAL